MVDLTAGTTYQNISNLWVSQYILNTLPPLVQSSCYMLLIHVVPSSPVVHLTKQEFHSTSISRGNDYDDLQC